LARRSPQYRKESLENGTDGTGDTGRVGGQTINSNNAAIVAAVNELASGQWEVDNVNGASIALGEKVIVTATATTKSIPAAAAIATDGYNTIMLWNSTASAITVDDGAALSVEVPASYLALFVSNGSSWESVVIPGEALTTDDLTDINVTSVADGEIWVYDSGTSKWINQTLEEADIVSRSTPAIEKNLYVKHETRSAAAASSTVTINLEDDPSVYVPIDGANVTIALTAPSLSLPERGLSDVKLAGKVFVKMNGTYAGLSASDNVTTVISNGSAPNTSGDWAILAWEYFDDGTNDVLWYEWLLES